MPAQAPRHVKQAPACVAPTFRAPRNWESHVQYQVARLAARLEQEREAPPTVEEVRNLLSIFEESNTHPTDDDYDADTIHELFRDLLREHRVTVPVAGTHAATSVPADENDTGAPPAGAGMVYVTIVAPGKTFFALKNNGKLEYECLPTAKIIDIHRCIYRAIGIDVSRQRLHHHGAFLDTSQTLGNLGLHGEVKLELTWEQRTNVPAG